MSGEIMSESTKLSETFFKSNADVGEKEKRSTGVPPLVSKGENRRFSSSYDVKFSIGSETFENMINFLSEIGHDVIFRFRKKEMILYILDVSSTHVAYVSVSNTECTEYIVKEEIDIYVDTSIVNDVLINKEYPVDVYIDTKEEKRLYIINGKEKVSRKLSSMEDSLSVTLQSYKTSTDKINLLTSEKSYQKVVVVQHGLKLLMNSLAKKASEDITLVNILLRRHEIDFTIEDDNKDCSILLTGEDVLVYPTEEERLDYNIEYFNKFNRLKLSYPVSLYCRNGMQLVFETKLGGGNIKLYFVVAPRTRQHE